MERRRRLTAQEEDVLRLHGLGRSARQIARELGIGEMTVAWIIANLVAERGARGTAELAQSLAAPPPAPVPPPRMSLFDLAVPLAVMLVLSFAAFAALAATGTLHFPTDATAAPASASPTAIGSATPSDESSGAGPRASTPPPANATSAPTPGGDASTSAPTVAPPATLAPLPTQLPVPTLAPVVPTVIPTAIPTAVPTLPIPLPTLPTVPPLPTPRLPPLSVP